MVATWDNRSEFEYVGCVLVGTQISYGKKNPPIFVSSQDYTRLRSEFLGRIIPVGASRTNPPKESLGVWLQNNVAKTAIASYVAPILIREGYAIRESETEIRIVR